MLQQLKASRGWLLATLLTAAVGVGVSIYLTRLHLDLFYGTQVGASLCDLGGGFDCSSVNASPESEVWGIPQSLLAIPVWLVAGALGWLAHKRQDARFAGLLSLLGLASVAYSARLAYVSATVIGAWCLFCMALYLVSATIAGLGLWAARGEGIKAAVRAPGLVAGVAGLGLVLFGASWLGYDHVRDGMAETAAAAAVAAPAQPAAGAAKVDDKATDAPSAQTKKLRLGVAKEGVVAPKGAPSRGPADARVTVVEFSDFQCPFCKRLAGSLAQLVDEYPKDLRLVYVQFPLNTDCNRADLKKSMHPHACDVAAASVCADQQGKFWEMHDKLFDRQTDTKAAALLGFARELGLDEGKFSACVASPATTATIAAQTEAGKPLGINGTPTFFINGRQLSGAQPIEVLRAVVDAELAGNREALALEVAVGTEETGAVESAATVAISGMNVQIDAFEASLDGKNAVSKAGVAPTRALSWADASAACEASGKRLCTEREWLAACTGQVPADADGNGVFSDDDQPGRRYGYGDARRSGVCADSRDPANVGELLTGNHPKCATPEGVYDMTGGVKEWVGLTAATAALKGGSYSSGESARCGYFRDDIAWDSQDDANGFRCCQGEPDPAPPAAVPGKDVGQKLAAFDLPLVDGSTWKSRSIAGKPTIITFWASWCGPCQKEMPALAAAYTQYKAMGLNVLGISVDSDRAKLDNWLKTHPMPFPIATDPGGAIMATFPTRALPTTLWIRPDSTIRLRTTGLPPGGEKRLAELVAELVGAPPPAAPPPAAPPPAPPKPE